MKDIYFYNLNINVDKIVYKDKILSLIKQQTIIQCDPKSFLKEDVIDKLSSLGKLHCLVFRKHKIQRNSIHIDDNQTSPCLNIIITGQGIMNWYDPKTKPKKFINPAGYYYTAWVENFGEPIAEWKEGKIAIVRVDIPHQVWTHGNEDRVCASIRWSKKLNIEETIDWFNKNF